MTFNPYDPAVRVDPYPAYREQRVRDPVHHSALGVWFISRYADGDQVLRDRRFGRNFERFLELQIGRGPLRTLLSGMMLYRDPPDHTRLRSLVTKAFTPRVVASMQPVIQRIVDDLIDARLASGRMDVIEDLAYPLPVLVICRMLGIPESDTMRFREWSRRLSAALDYVLTSDVVAQANAAAEASAAYLRALVAKRRGAPADDLVSRLIHAEEHGQQLSEAEIVSTCMFLFGAGHETTTGLIGNGVLALLHHPGELARLRATPSLVASAVDEILRYDAPVQMAGRVATEDVVVGGHTVGDGDVVVVLLGAANRDPDRFVAPDVLDIGRRDNAPLSFGGGIHYCLGAALARVETQAALRTLAERLDDLRLAGDPPRWRDTVVLRGLERLSVRFSPRR